MKSRVANIIERALSTFWQAALASLATAAAATNLANVNLPALRAIGLAALGAGIASVLSVAKNLTATLAGDHAVAQKAGTLTASTGQANYATGGYVITPPGFMTGANTPEATIATATPPPTLAAAPAAPPAKAKRSRKAVAKQ